jgi:hypothetical protein
MRRHSREGGNRTSAAKLFIYFHLAALAIAKQKPRDAGLFRFNVEGQIKRGCYWPKTANDVSPCATGLPILSESGAYIFRFVLIFRFSHSHESSFAFRPYLVCR